MGALYPSRMAIVAIYRQQQKRAYCGNILLVCSDHDLAIYSATLPLSGPSINGHPESEPGSAPKQQIKVLLSF